MKKLLLLDADVIMDLHTLGLFNRIAGSYHLYATDEVIGEADYYKKDGSRIKINLSGKVEKIENVQISSLQTINNEAQEARLSIDPGELISIAYLYQTEDDILFCSCDKAAIKLVSYVGLENKSISMEKALRDTDYNKRNLYPRHYEKTFRDNIQAGKTLRIQFKKFT